MSSSMRAGSSMLSTSYTTWLRLSPTQRWCSNFVGRCMAPSSGRTAPTTSRGLGDPVGVQVGLVGDPARDLHHVVRAAVVGAFTLGVVPHELGAVELQDE